MPGTRPRRRPTATTEQNEIDIGALEQRVYGTEAAIADLSLQTSSQIQSLRDDLSSSIAAISKKLDDRSPKLLPIILACCGVLGVAGGFFATILSPIQGDIGKLEHGLDKTNTVIQSLLATSATQDAQQKFGQAQQESNQRIFDAIQKSLDAKWPKEAQLEYERRIDENLHDRREDNARTIAALQTEIANIRDGLVTRAEHVAHWSEFASRIDAMTLRINDMQKEYSASFNMGDALKDLQKQLSDLRSNIVVHAGPAMTGKP